MRSSQMRSVNSLCCYNAHQTSEENAVLYVAMLSLKLLHVKMNY